MNDTDGFDGDDGEHTQRVDFAALFTTKVGLAICEGAARAGRIGDRLGDAGREPPRPTPAQERLKYLGIAKDIGDAIEAFALLIEHLRDGMALAREQAANAYPRKDGAE